jgi:hypothetical protein
MVTKRGKKPTKEIRTLPAKSLSAKQAKGVKGGFVYGNVRTTMGDGSVLTTSGFKQQKV